MPERNENGRRQFLQLLANSTIAGATGATLLRAKMSCAATTDEKKPNFVFILVDDLGWRDVGFTGSRYYETPQIDRLAREGMVFTNAYANAPNCAPTRACLLSGQYTPRHGIYTVGTSERGQSKHRKLIPTPNTTTLAPGIRTLAEALHTAGYANAHVGKWHLGSDPDSGPRAQGFDRNIAGNRAGAPKSYFSPYKNPDLDDGPEGEYLTDRLTDEALGFMEEHRDRPFFLYMSHYAVHTPIQAQEAILQKYKQKPPDNGQNNPAYAAMVESTDRSVGRIVEKLDALGIAENTVVVFFSDNGGHGGVTSNAPLRGAKGMLYEGGIREPAIVRWPGRIRPGSTCDVPVIGLDFYPTLLEMAGVRREPGQVLDGESLVPLLTGKGTLHRDTLFWHFPAYLESFRSRGKAAASKDGRIREVDLWRTTPAGAVRQGDFKLIEFFEDGRLELYNLREDISERDDLAQALPEKVRALHALLLDWRREVNAPVPVELNPDFGRQR